MEDCECISFRVTEVVTGSGSCWFLEVENCVEGRRLHAFYDIPCAYEFDE